ncbi:MAG TPA: VWA domain-containing protein [Vicinamibacterales bacterium]|nr:VWA domain-containing protein [Vicinamibacterales bacterium]
MIRFCIVALATSASLLLDASQPTFSARVDGIRVDILVTDSSRKPLRGLTPADFVIRDNGVPQQVDVVSYGEIALNVGLAFDLSESVAGARLGQLTTASRALTSELRPADQSALVTFDHAVSLPCPLSTDRTCIDSALSAAKPAGSTALIDGVFAGMMVGESDVGRSLLMVFSDGHETASFLRAERVLDMGRRTDVVVYPIAPKGSRPDFLEELASLTGGRLHEVERTEDLSKTFRAILDEFRHRYLVTYTPRNVPQGGWHKLDVRVNKPGARVKARPGYQGT